MSKTVIPTKDNIWNILKALSAETSQRIREHSEENRKRFAETNQQIKALSAESHQEIKALSAENRQRSAEVEQQIKALSAESRQEIKALSAENRQRSAEVEQQIKALSAETSQEIKALSAETNQQIKALSAESRQEIKALSAENRKFSEESRQRSAEWEQERKKRSAEWEQQMKKRSAEWEQRMKENSIKSEKIDKRLDKAIGLFETQWGKLMESLVEGDLVKILQAQGIEVTSTHTNVKHRSEKDQYEYDILAINGKEVVGVEVKTTLKVKHVKAFLEELKKFKSRLPNYKDSTIYGAVAF